MNLYFRLLIVLLKSLLAQRGQLFKPSLLKFRAWPLDCDLNLHITNSRYLGFMDLGRTYWLGQQRILSTLLRRGWGPILQASEITYFKSIKLGQPFTLQTKLIYWDEKYFYMEQRFSMQASCFAIAMIRGLFVGRGKKIPTARIMQLLNTTCAAPPLPAAVAAWQRLLAAKKSLD